MEQVKEQKIEDFICPKSVRQIGDVEENIKVYIEDYVITLMNQISKKNIMGSSAVLLLGKYYQVEDKFYYFIYGAIPGMRQRIEEGSPLFNQEEQEELLKEKEEFFNQYTIIGWALIESQFNTVTQDTVWMEMSGLFGSMNKIALVFDVEEDDFYLTRKYENTISKIKGYQIFYDTNKEMQNYLIDWNQNDEEEVHKVDQEPDIVTQKIRTVIHEKQEVVNQKKIANVMYACSLIIMIVMCLTGVTMLNNYEKLKKVELAITHLTETMKENELASSKVDSDLIVNGTNGLTNDKELQTSWENEMEMENTRKNANKEGIDSATNTNSSNIAIDKVEEEQPEEEKPTEQDSTTMQEEKGEDTVTEEEVVNAAKITPCVTYVVQKGDTLRSICFAQYQTYTKVEEVCKLNNITNPDNIVEGQKILLP